MVDRTANNKILVIDRGDPDFGEAFLDACRSIGFVAITGHGFRPGLFEDVRAMLNDLFAVDEATKQAAAITKDNCRGFIPLGFFTPNREEANGITPDLYEGYKLHWECPTGHPALAETHLYGPNRWIDAVPQMQPLIAEYWAACDQLAARLLDVCASALAIDATTMRSWHQAPLTDMTLLH
jgi:isopenicillin N synthase-like dioxygenase